EYDRLVQSCYYSTCGVPTYTVGGSLLYNVIDNRMSRQIDPSAYVNPWLEDHNRLMPHCALPDSVATRRNLVIINCESLESWVINKEIDGKPITPYLDSLVLLPNTFYAPNVLTQVSSGRSIDALLLMHSGLLPMVSSVYSMKYPSATYPTLNKALKQIYGSESYIFTCDKPITWNIEAISRAFGYNRLIDRRSFTLDEMIGNPAKLSDGSFLRQCAQMIKTDSTLWPVGEPRMLTFNTYSGHSPFILPDKFKDPAFDISGNGLPERLNDYITMAHYTDSQLHTLIGYIQSRPDYEDTIIVIVGDHEGLAGLRSDFLKSSTKAHDIISTGQYTPFIILNSPIAGYYPDIMGQVDIYPTLLNLLGADEYFWKGLGQSIFCADKPKTAISSMTYEIAGDTASVNSETMEHLKKARRVSDAIIRGNLLK
ncbi:MAG: LTA synthase family protein, partial [Muribaculaceae bacterium]|nr:LTA synthase family protein [Muribaculaceae bacterium]